MKDGSNFLHYKNVEKGIIIFITRLGKEVLQQNQTFFMDGTFKVCCMQFYQLYTIHVDVGSTDVSRNVVPVVYALLADKRKDTYEHLFSVLKNSLPNWKPTYFKLDFEIAVITALQTVFPGAQISGCNFHFNQAIWRRVQNLGMVEDYKNDANVRLTVRMCASLAFLPPQDVDDGWLHIMSSTPENRSLTNFLDYFTEQWLENSTISKDMWNCHSDRYRSNNILEGWNHRFNTLVRKPHPNIYELIQCLKEEGEYGDFLYKRTLLHFDGKRRKKVYIELDTKILKILEQYRVDLDIEKCLKAIAYVHKLE